MDQSNTSANKLEKELDPSGFSSMKSAVGFSVFGLVAALLVVPMMQGKSKNPQQLAAANVQSENGVDKITTASVAKPRVKKRYTVRRNVLQRDPNVPCIIYENGTREGNC